MNIPKLSALYESSLASSLSAAGTSFSVVSGTDRDGNALSGSYGFIIDEGSADEEFFVGSISGTTVTVTYRGCDAESPATEVSANKKAHRRGASVKITDYPILGFLRNALAAETGYELPAFLKMTTGIGNPTDNLHLVTKAYADAILSGGTGIPNRIVVAGTAGETIAAGNLIYFDDTDNEWKLCDADTAATVENVMLGIAQGAGTDGVAISSGVLILGVDSNQSGLTIGAKYFASNTAGAISSSAGTKEVTIGWGKAATELYFYPRFDQQLTEDQQDALAGGGSLGTPSASNKYQTETGVTAAIAAITNPIIRVYTSNDTWSKPASLKYVIAEVIGGGGGGGGADNDSAAGGGGGGGGYSRKKIAVASLGATETVTVGAAGSAGGDTGTDGGAGGTSSLGSHLQATGGALGAGDTNGGQALGGAGGVGSLGDFNLEGDDGDSGFAAGAGTGVGGRGGSSTYGGGGKGGKGDAAGSAGNVYGGGGGGGASNSTTGRAGGAGAAGVVIVTEYYS